MKTYLLLLLLCIAIQSIAQTCKEYTYTYTDLLKNNFKSTISYSSNYSTGYYISLYLEDSINYRRTKRKIKVILKNSKELHLTDPWFKNEIVYTTIYKIENTTNYLIINLSVTTKDKYLTIATIKL